MKVGEGLYSRGARGRSGGEVRYCRPGGSLGDGEKRWYWRREVDGEGRGREFSPYHAHTPSDVSVLPWKPLIQPYISTASREALER